MRVEPEKFDAGYYQRFYFSAATRVAEPEYLDRVASFLSAYLGLLGCPVDDILDVGCGAGLIHSGLKRAWPGVSIDAFDVSAYACDKYGWENSSIESFQTDKVYDLVICHDVVQYLDRKTAETALEKLG